MPDETSDGKKALPISDCEALELFHRLTAEEQARFIAYWQAREASE